MDGNRNEAVALAEIPHIQLDVPVDAITQLTTVTYPNIDVRFGRPTVWAGEIEADAVRVIRNGYRRVADDHVVLPAKSCTYVESLQTTFTEVVIGDRVEAPFTELRNAGAFLQLTGSPLGTDVVVPLEQRGFVTGSTPPDAEVASALILERVFVSANEVREVRATDVVANRVGFGGVEGEAPVLGWLSSELNFVTFGCSVFRNGEAERRAGGRLSAGSGVESLCCIEARVDLGLP